MYFTRVKEWDGQWHRIRNASDARSAARETARLGDNEGFLALGNKTLVVEVQYRHTSSSEEDPVETFDVECLCLYQAKRRK